MRITTEQLQQHLAGGLKALYTVFGDETLLALEASDRIRARARAEGYAERLVLTADSGFKWNELAFAGASQSLFGARGSATFLSRATAVLAVIFFSTSLGLAVVYSRQSAEQTRSITEQVEPVPAAPIPQAPVDSGAPAVPK